VSWIKDRIDEKQVVLEQEWLRDRNAVERHPARTIEEAWSHMVAAIERDVHEFNALKLCGDQEVRVSSTPEGLELAWNSQRTPLLTLSVDHSQDQINYKSSTKNSKDRCGKLTVRVRRGSHAVLYDGRPSPLTYEEASQYFLQPVLMP
jgi:hypothetical protein